MKKLMTIIAAVAAAFGLCTSTFAGMTSLEFEDWFTENAISITTAKDQGDGKTQYGVWSNLTDQVDTLTGRIAVDADDETAVAYRPNEAPRGAVATIYMSEVKFDAARMTLPPLEAGTQAAVAITTNAEGECVFAVANGGKWELTTTEASLDLMYNVRVDFLYSSNGNTVSYALDQLGQLVQLKEGAVNPVTAKVSTVEFAGSGSFKDMLGERELANYTISFTGIPAGIAEITVDGTPVDEDGKATVAEGSKNVVIGFVAKSGYRVSPETKTLPGPIDGNISYTAENFPVKVFKWVAGVTVNGTDVSAGSGTGWTYDETTHTVEIKGKGGSYVLSGSNTTGEVMFAIDADANVTLSNLCLKCTTEDECCVWAANNTVVTLYLAGTNTLGGGLCVENGTHLVVTNALGFADADAVLIAEGGLNLTAIAVGRSGPECAKPTFEIAGGTVYANWEWGVYGAAGIGTSLIAGTDGEADIVISGGRVFARGGQHAPGIGGAHREKSAGAPDIRITGGYVEAVGGQFAAGIGGADGGKYGSATVSGGTVRVTRGDNAFDMLAGASDDGGGDFTVTGGSIWLADGALVKPAPSNGTARVWCVTVPGVATGKPTITGLDGYGTKDIVAVDGNIYLWLQDGVYDFTVDGKTYKAKVSGANTEAVEQPATPLAPGHSSDPFDSETEAWAAVNGGLISFGPTDKVKEVLDASTILTVEGYKEMFTPVVYQTKEDGKWRVMYELTASATNTLMQSIHDVVTKIDLAEITTEGVASMFLEGGVPGFYYTLFASDAVTTVTEPSSRDKENSDRFCDEDGFVFFWNVEKPSDAAGFFTVSVSAEQAFTSGEPSADVRGGGIIVLPPVITTGSDD